MPVEEYYQDRHFPGLSITIVDFMANMPVRLKTRLEKLYFFSKELDFRSGET